MLKIAVCDDESNFRDEISNELAKVLKAEGFAYSIDCYSSGEELIKYLKRGNDIYNILFSDINMKSLNGIETAKLIREFNSLLEIVFVSKSKDFVLESYDVGAAYYLLKSEYKDKLKRVLIKAINKLEVRQKRFLVIRNSNGIRLVYLGDIEFIEIHDKMLTVHTIHENISYSGKIGVLRKKLTDKNFILTHRSYLVNMSKINEVTSSYIKVLSGKMVLLSRNRVKEVKSTYSKYVSEVYKIYSIPAMFFTMGFCYLTIKQVLIR